MLAQQGWAVLRVCWAHPEARLQLCWATLNDGGAMMANLRQSWPYVGGAWRYVGPSWGKAGPS